MKPVGFCTLSAHELKVFLSTGIKKNPILTAILPFQGFWVPLHTCRLNKEYARLYRKELLWPPKIQKISC
jgi:hypothetical protein